MPYTYSARGDYYRGDYYRGDPGLLGNLFRGVVGAAKGFITGGITGAVTGGISGLVGRGAHPNLPQPKTQVPQIAPPTFAPTQTGLINVGGGGSQTGLINYMPPPETNGSSMMYAPAGPTPLKGYHLNKSTYETRGGGTSRWPAGLQLHPKGTVLVKNRRMNVGNARALKRSLRRAGGFARLARRVMSFTHPRAGRGHFKFKKRARR